MFSPHRIQQSCVFKNIGKKCSPINARNTDDDNYAFGIICRNHMEFIFHITRESITVETSKGACKKYHTSYFTSAPRPQVIPFPFRLYQREGEERMFCLDANLMTTQINQFIDCLSVTNEEKRNLMIILYGLMNNGAIMFAGDYNTGSEAACYQAEFQKFFATPHVRKVFQDRYHNIEINALLDNGRYARIAMNKLPFLYQVLFMYTEVSSHTYPNYNNGRPLSIPFSILLNLQTHFIEKFEEDTFTFYVKKPHTQLATPLVFSGYKTHVEEVTEDDFYIFTPYSISTPSSIFKTMIPICAGNYGNGGNA